MPADRPGILRHKRFLLLAGSSLLTLLLVGAVFALGGRELLIDSLKENEGDIANWMSNQEAQGTGRNPADILFAAFFACALALWVLFVFVGLGFLQRWKWRWRLLGLPLFYLCTETLVAPHVAVPLKMNDYFYVQDPDHWPGSTDPEFGYNSDALRCPHQPESFRPEDLNVVILGDSFTYGLGLPPEKCFPAKIERMLRQQLAPRTVKVANFGWTSSSPLLSARRLEAIGEKYHPDVVAICVDMTDFGDDLRWASMLDRRGVYRFHAWLPLATHAFKSWAPKKYRDYHFSSLGDPPRKRMFITEAPLDRSREFMTPLADNLDRIHRWCLDHDAEFVVFFAPRGYQYSAKESPRNRYKERVTVLGPHCMEPFRWVQEIAPTKRYPIHSLFPAFKNSRLFPTCFVNDPHWNDNGTTITAQAITPQLVPPLRRRMARRE